MRPKPQEVEAEVIRQIKEYGISDSSLVLHERTDIPDLMNAMDILIFPSQSEGLGNVAVEAQAAGLHCLMSSGVPQAADISNYAEHMSLSCTPKEWADKAISMCEATAAIEYKDYDAWDMKNVVSKLLSYYEEALKE